MCVYMCVCVGLTLLPGEETGDAGREVPMRIRAGSTEVEEKGGGGRDEGIILDSAPWCERVVADFGSVEREAGQIGRGGDKWHQHEERRGKNRERREGGSRVLRSFEDTES